MKSNRTFEELSEAEYLDVDVEATRALLEQLNVGLAVRGDRYKQHVVFGQLWQHAHLLAIKLATAGDGLLRVLAHHCHALAQRALHGEELDGAAAVATGTSNAAWTSAERRRVAAQAA